MTDEEFISIARNDPEKLREMMTSERQRQSDMQMSAAELTDSQMWVAKAQAALNLVKAEHEAEKGHEPHYSIHETG